MNKKTEFARPGRLAGHKKLEPRRLLNASFDLGVGGDLTLNDFADTDADPEQVTISGGAGVYTFFLDDGVWSGVDGANITGDTTDTLTVTGIGTLTSILLDSNLADQFDIQFGDFDFDGAINITNSTGIAFGNVNQVAAADDFVHTDTLTISGAENIDLSNADNELAIVDITNATDVSLNDSSSDLTLTSLAATNNATVVADGNVDVAGAVIGGDLDITSTTGDITDSGTITVTGNAVFTSGGSVTMDQLDVTGSIGVTSSVNVEITNTTTIVFSLSDVTGNLDATATTGNITDASTITVGGDACFDADSGDITLDGLAVTGQIGVEATGNATIVNATGIDFKLSDVGATLDATATTGNITDAGNVIVGGDACFDAVAGSIDLDLLNVTGSIGVDAATSATIVNAVAVDLKTSNVGTDLDVTATTGSITDSGTITVGGDACFDSADAITLDTLAVTGSIGLISVNNANITNATGIDFKASNVGGILDATATTGNITDSGNVIVGGDACFDAVAGSIDLDLLNVTGSIGVDAATSATIVNTTGIDFKASNVGGTLDATATTGNITDAGNVIVGGDACFDAVAGSIDLDLLNVTGSIGVDAATSATIVNAVAVDLKTSNVVTDLDVTATTGSITDSGTITVGGDACFDSADAITLDSLAVTGSIGLISANNANITNATGIDFKASNVGGTLDATATTGNITDSGNVIVGGDACFDAVTGSIDLDLLDVTGSIGVDAATSATIVNAVAVDLKTSNVVTDLDVTATTGSITDSGTITVGGDACFDSADAITLDSLAVTGSIGLISANNANITNATGIDFKASNVGGTLDATATTGNITDSGNVIVGGDACFDAVTGSIDLDLLDVTGSIGVDAATSATIVNAVGVDLKASNVGTDLDVTATTGDVTDSGVATVGGDACFEATNGAIELDLVAATGSVGLVSNGNATFTATSIDFKASNVGGNLIAVATGGDITQTAGIVVSGTSSFTSSDIICLIDTANDFIMEVTATGDVVEIVDANALQTGVITAVDDIFLRSGATAAGALTLNGSLTTSAAVGQTLLQSSDGISQAGGIISTSELLVGGNVAAEGTGSFVLTQLNDVGTLAATITGSLDFINNGPIVVGDLTYSSACLTSEAITGLDVSTKIRLRAQESVALHSIRQ